MKICIRSKERGDLSNHEGADFGVLGDSSGIRKDHSYITGSHTVSPLGSLITIHPVARTGLHSL